MTTTTDALDSEEGTDDTDVLSVMRDRLTTAMAAYADSRTCQLDDLRFAAGSPDNNWQWPDYAKNTRRIGDGDNVMARPMLTVNQLPQHIRQVTNDQRMNRPGIDVVSANGDAHVEVADVFEGVIRHIEQISDADVAYDTAVESSTIHGEGYFRIITKYENPKSFNQEIYILAMDNPFCVYLDPMASPEGENAEWGLILDDLTHKEYKAQFKNAKPISSLELETGVGDEVPWLNEKTIRIAEYFYKECVPDTLYRFSQGHTAFKDEPEYEVYKKHFGPPTDERESSRDTIWWIKTNGYETLEKKKWAGDSIPIIRVIGNRFRIEGQVYLSGIVRNAKDPQRMYNYQCSQEVEMLALAPKSPYVGVAGQFKGYEKQWKTANVQNWPYMEYNMVVSDDGQLAPPPQRVQPPMIQSGIIEAKRAALDDIKNATGQYNASLGQVSNERSGKAILARKNEGDVSTYHFGDNLSRAIRTLGKKLVNLIPKIYDEPGRVARTIGTDGSESMVEFDSTKTAPVTPVVDPNDPTIVIKKIYNPTVGKYDVAVVTGKGYATKRQEALESMAQLLQTNPALWSVAGDLFVKNMDWPGAQELAKRFSKTIDPKLLQGDDVSPALQKAQQQIQELTQALDHAHSMLTNVNSSFESREMAVKEAEMKIKAFDAETKRIAVLKPADQPGLTEGQIQDIATGTVHAALQAGDPAGTMPQQGPQQPQEAPPPMDQTKLMQEDSKHVLQANQHAHEVQMAQMQAEQQAQQPAPGGDQ